MPSVYPLPPPPPHTEPIPRTMARTLCCRSAPVPPGRPLGRSWRGLDDWPSAEVWAAERGNAPLFGEADSQVPHRPLPARRTSQTRSKRTRYLLFQPIAAYRTSVTGKRNKWRGRSSCRQLPPRTRRCPFRTSGRRPGFGIAECARCPLILPRPASTPSPHPGRWPLSCASGRTGAAGPPFGLLVAVLVRFAIDCIMGGPTTARLLGRRGRDRAALGALGVSGEAAAGVEAVGAHTSLDPAASDLGAPEGGGEEEHRHE